MLCRVIFYATIVFNVIYLIFFIFLLRCFFMKGSATHVHMCETYITISEILKKGYFMTFLHREKGVMLQTLV